MKMTNCMAFNKVVLLTLFCCFLPYVLLVTGNTCFCDQFWPLFFLVQSYIRPISRPQKLGHKSRSRKSVYYPENTVCVFRALDQFSSVFGSKVMPKIFQICQEFPKAFRGFPKLIFYHFFRKPSTRNVKMSIKPSKTSYYSLECIWISRGFAPLILLDSRTPTGRWRHGLFIETCQNNLWFCKHSQKSRNRTAKFFFQPNYKSFPIQNGFEQLSNSIRWRVMSI